jgi:hypothetical protein
VFILGVSQRSGTNFVCDILKEHPQFAQPQHIWEAFLLEHIRLLDEYYQGTSRRWAIRQMPPDTEHVFQHDMGRALLGFLRRYAPPGKTMIAKSPSVVGLDRYYQYFPECPLILLMRDGRDVVQSASKVFPFARRLSGFREMARRWAEGARTMQRFMAAHPDRRDRPGDGWKLIRYEDLITEPEQSLAALCEFLGLRREDFAIDGLERLRLHGSSSASGGTEPVIGRRTERPADFRPIGRWRGWNLARRCVFKWVAGRELVHWGYVREFRW